jgi:hypothetical protein
VTYFCVSVFINLKKSVKSQNNRFTWNLGALVGSAVGCSAWMAIIPFTQSWQTSVMVAALACPLGILLAVPLLWWNRSKMSALTGIYCLLVIAFAATMVFLFTGNRTGFFPWQAGHIRMVLIYPVMVLGFYLLGRRNMIRHQ